MLVVSDSTPLHYLILIGEVDLLRSLYGEVILPAGVIDELSAPQTPNKVRAWIAEPPSWASVVQVPAGGLPFPHLGQGEREAIALTRSTVGGILLTDDLEARIAAESLNIQVVPTIRILSTASALSLVDFKDAIERLQRTNFRVARKVIESILKPDR